MQTCCSFPENVWFLSYDSRVAVFKHTTRRKRDNLVNPSPQVQEFAFLTSLWEALKNSMQPATSPCSYGRAQRRLHNPALQTESWLASEALMSTAFGSLPGQGCCQFSGI